MGTNEIIQDAFGRINEEVHRVLDGIGNDALLFRPSGKGNSIAWLIWHLTRVQDDHISELAGHEQTWITDGWYDTFGLPFDTMATGYGQSSEEVGKVKASMELLLGYHDAVHQKTVAFLGTLTPDDYDTVVDTSWNPPVTMSVRLISVVSDDLQHVGQAAYVRGLQK